MLTESGGALRLVVHAQPGAKRNAMIGAHGDALKIAVTAPPLDGKANEAIALLIAEFFGVPLHTVRVISGFHSRRKTVSLTGLSLGDAQQRLNQLISG